MANYAVTHARSIFFKRPNGRADLGLLLISRPQNLELTATYGVDGECVDLTQAQLFKGGMIFGRWCFFGMISCGFLNIFLWPDLWLLVTCLSCLKNMVGLLPIYVCVASILDWCQWKRHSISKDHVVNVVFVSLPFNRWVISVYSMVWYLQIPCELTPRICYKSLFIKKAPIPHIGSDSKLAPNMSVRY